MSLGITPKVHISSFCPIVQPGEATRPFVQPQLSPQHSGPAEELSP